MKRFTCMLGLLALSLVAMPLSSAPTFAEDNNYLVLPETSPPASYTVADIIDTDDYGFGSLATVHMRRPELEAPRTAPSIFDDLVATNLGPLQAPMQKRSMTQAPTQAPMQKSAQKSTKTDADQFVAFLPRARRGDCSSGACSSGSCGSSGRKVTESGYDSSSCSSGGSGFVKVFTAPVRVMVGRRR